MTTPGPYQRVNTPTDYDADPSKFPAYLRFDGVDNAMVTVGNVDLSGTDKVTVWVGATKLSDAAIGVIAELGVFSNTGMYGTASIYGQANGFGFGSRGTSGTIATISSGFAAPSTTVLSGSSHIGGPLAELRAGGVQAVSASTQGLGNFGSHLLYIGARIGTSSYFNGRLYSLIVRGAQSTLSHIEATEAYIKQKMRLP